MHIYIIAGPPPGRRPYKPHTSWEMWWGVLGDETKWDETKTGGLVAAKMLRSLGVNSPGVSKTSFFSSLFSRVCDNFLECQGITNILHIKPSEIHRNTETCDSMWNNCIFSRAWCVFGECILANWYAFSKNSGVISPWESWSLMLQQCW